MLIEDHPHAVDVDNTLPNLDQPLVFSDFRNRPFIARSSNAFVHVIPRYLSKTKLKKLFFLICSLVDGFYE